MNYGQQVQLAGKLTPNINSLKLTGYVFHEPDFFVEEDREQARLQLWYNPTYDIGKLDIAKGQIIYCHCYDSEKIKIIKEQTSSLCHRGHSNKCCWTEIVGHLEFYPFQNPGERRTLTIRQRTVIDEVTFEVRTTQLMSPSEAREVHARAVKSLERD